MTQNTSTVGSAGAIGHGVMVIDQEFHAPRTPVAVVAIRDSGEALLIRAMLESLGAFVTLHLPGTPEDFLRILAQGQSAPNFMVISGHGDRGGFAFGDYADEIDTRSLTDGMLLASVITTRVHLPGKFVVSTACGTGSAGLGAAFATGKVAAYVAPAGDPEGAATPLFVHHLFYQLLQRKTPFDAALAHARGYDAESLMFVRA